jgi:ubiquinone/menaquinone biosynthesis C-methylase UbiE
MRGAESQAEYYARTAERYDDWHVHEEDEHSRALHIMSAFIRLNGLSSVLDVGSGTGRGLRHLAREHPGIRCHGVEPVGALIERAVASGLDPGSITQGRGEQLAFPDSSFDAVCETGVLHHVARPGDVVGEMTRVARRAIFISDDNRFGWGSWPRRALKLGLYRTGIWQSVVHIRTRGRGYSLSEDDGVAYSYSAFDSYSQLAAWADEVLVFATAGGGAPWRYPLLTASHVLVCALRDEPGPVVR